MMKSTVFGNVRVLGFAAAVATGFLFSASPGQAEERDFTLEGIYEGTIAMGGTTEVPFQVSLALTGELAPGPDGNLAQVIDGAFLVDGEGGAFAFSKVTFDLREGRLDMRYNRPEVNVNPQLPSSFRLIGKFDADGVLQGRALSGSHGPVGTFVMKHADRGTFVTSERYLGRWKGDVDLTSGGKARLDLSLLPSSGATKNPTDYEFDFSAGKLGRIVWNGLSITADTVTVDYLRNLVTLRKLNANGTVGLSFEFSIDRATHVISGAIRSPYRGDIAHFKLSPDATASSEPAAPPAGRDDPILLHQANGIEDESLRGTDWLEFYANSPDVGVNWGVFNRMRVEATGPSCYTMPLLAQIYENRAWRNLSTLQTGLFGGTEEAPTFVPGKVRLGFTSAMPEHNVCDIKVTGWLELAR